MRKLFLVFLLIFFSIPLYAHGGGTDINGGHHDRKNGGYHFHHGKAPHQHKNESCPYNNNNSDGSSTWHVIGIGILGFIIYNIYNKK